MKFLSLITICCLLAFGVKCQERIYVDNKSVIETKEGSIIVFNNFNKYNLYFYIDHKGDLVETTERDILFNVGTFSLQVLVVEKSKHNGKNDSQILKNYAEDELGYFSKQLKAKLKSKSDILSVGDKTECILWQYEMPTSISKDVKNQLFISFIYKDYIIGLNSTQFSDQTFEEVLEFLKKVVSETTITEERITFEYLCNKRK